MGAPQYKHKVLQYLMDRPGMVLHCNDIQGDLGLKAEQVKTAVFKLRQLDDKLFHDIVIMIPGQAWMYRPNQIESTGSQRTVAVPTGKSKVHAISPSVKNPFLANAEQDEVQQPPAKPKGHSFDVVGTTSSGFTIVKDERGRLFKVVPLD